MRNVDVLRFDPATVAVSDGLDTGEIVVTAGVQALHPGQKVRLLGIGAMSGFNLSEWALKHRSLVVYLMIVAVVAGLVSYFRLGRNEDPAFIIKTMVVQAAWPGATVDDTLKQVTERLERKLQETPKLDFLRSFTTRRRHDDLRQSAGQRDRREGRRTSGITSARASATSATPCRPASSGRASTTSSATRSASSTASPPTASPIASCATMSRTSAPSCCSVPDVSKIEILGAQDERIFVEFSMKELASLGIDRSALIAALQAQNVVQPGRHHPDRRRDAVAARVGRVPVRAGHARTINFVVGGRMLRLSDIAQVRRGYRRSAAADVSRQRRAGDRARHRHARRRRHPGARQEHHEGDGARSPPTCRSASSRSSSPTRRSRSRAPSPNS